MERRYGAVSRFILVCAVAASGCAATAPRAPDSADTGRTSSAVPLAGADRDELLHYIETVRAMPADELEREAAAVDADANGRPSAANRLRLGIFLGFAPPPYRATARAQEILDSVWRDEGDDKRDVVRLLLAVLQDRQQLETALNDERRQRQALRNKLDQLKAIEEDLDRRMQPSVINPR